MNQIIVMEDEYFEYSPPPFIKKLEKYNRGRNDLQVSLGDLKFQNQKTDLYITRIYVDPDSRHNGIGNAMLSDIIKLGKEYGYKKIWLEASFSTTFSGNTMSFNELKNWYIRKGFVISDGTDDKVQMYKEL